MNKKLERLIQDTAATLGCTGEQTKYLSTCMELAFENGKREQLVEDAGRLNQLVDRQLNEPVKIEVIKRK